MRQTFLACLTRLLLFDACFCRQCVISTKNTIYLSINKWLFFKISRSVFAIHINISWSCATRETKKCKWAGTSNHSYCWLMWKHYQFGHSRSGSIGLYVFLAYNTFRSGRWWRVVHLLRNILLETFFKRVAKCVFDFLCLWYAFLLKCLLHKYITNFKFWFDFNQSAKKSTA